MWSFLFIEKNFGPPPPRGGGAAPPEIFFWLFFTFQTIFSRFRPKKISNFFSPRTGSTLPPSLGEKFFEIFFWSKSTQNGLKREKKPKKFQGGGRAAPPGGGRFFFQKIYPKTSLHAKIQPNRSSHLFRDPPPPPPTMKPALWYSPIITLILIRFSIFC